MNTTKRITGTAQIPYKWSDPVYAGKKRVQHKNPQAKSYRKQSRFDKARAMLYVDVFAVLLLGALLIISRIQFNGKDEMRTAQMEEQIRLEEQIEARRQELDKNTSYEIIARLSHDQGFRDSNELARIDLRVPNRRAVETASR